MKRMIAAILLITAISILAGCSGKAAGSTAAGSGEVVVQMKNIQFSPAKITVKKGTKITFVNKDAMEHDIWQIAVKELGKQDPSFRSPVINPTAEWSVVMEQTGTYPILCAQMGHFTAGMVGTIEVVD